MIGRAILRRPPDPGSGESCRGKYRIVALSFRFLNIAIAAITVSILAIASVIAQMYPSPVDGRLTVTSNGASPVTAVGPGSGVASTLMNPLEAAGGIKGFSATTPTVANNTALTALPSTYAAAIIRLGYAVVGDAPPLAFQSSSSTCSISGGDGGSQVPSSDGKCWLAVFPSSGIDPTWFGASATATDNTANFDLALNAVKALGTGGTLQIPAGRFRFTGQPTFSYPGSFGNLTIIGAGRDTTILAFSGSGGVILTANSYLNSFVGEHFTISTTATNGGKGIYFNQIASVGASNPAGGSHSLLADVSVRGDDAIQGSDYWTDAIYINNWSNINIESSLITAASGYLGNLIHVRGTSSSGPIGGPVNLIGVYLLGGNAQLYVDVYAQGITATATNFNQGMYGIYCPLGTGVDQISVTNSQFSELTADVIDNGCYSLQAVNNFFYVVANNSVAISLQNAYRFTISNNFFDEGVAVTSTTAIQELAYTAPGVIVGNVISNLTTGISYPNAGSYTDVVADNQYQNVRNPVEIASGAGAVSDQSQPFASLPRCSSTFIGRRATVNNSSTNTWGATIAGGGSYVVAAYCNGSNWTLMAK